MVISGTLSGCHQAGIRAVVYLSTKRIGEHCRYVDVLPAYVCREGTVCGRKRAACPFLLGIGGLEHIIFPVDQPVVLGSKLGGSLDGIAVGVSHQFSFIVEFLLATKL